ncbi:hypothetical protein ATCC90586_000527 [Pythium insidiosum]|nr:hypothetical protein ATCC90586_000527 [Pythium insidiosum]
MPHLHCELFVRDCEHDAQRVFSTEYKRLLSSHLAAVLRSLPPTRDAYVPTERDVTQYVTYMLLQPFVSHQQALLRVSSGVLRVEAQLDTFRAWVASLSSELERLVQQLSNRLSLDFLVDEIVSCMYDEDPDGIPRSQREVTRHVLRNTNFLGWETYSEQLRQCASTSRIAALMGRLQGSRAMSGAPWLPRGVTSDPDGLNAELRSIWSIFPDLSSVFVMDGRHHASAVFPNGVAPCVWHGLGFGGPALVAGDYRAALRQPARGSAASLDRISDDSGCRRGDDDNSLALELDLFVYALHGASYCLQLTMIPSLSTQDRASPSPRALHVYARLYRGHLVAASDDGSLDSAAHDTPTALPSHGELLLLSPEERRALAQFPEAVASLCVTAKRIRAYAHGSPSVVLGIMALQAERSSNATEEIGIGLQDCIDTSAMGSVDREASSEDMSSLVVSCGRDKEAEDEDDELLFEPAPQEQNVPVAPLELTIDAQVMDFESFVQGQEELRTPSSDEDGPSFPDAVELSPLRALLFPLEWSHVYVPVLPMAMKGYLHCPTPFIFGLHTSYAGHCELPKMSDDLALVNLDRNSVTGGGDVVLPPARSCSLRSRLVKLCQPRLQFRDQVTFSSHSASDTKWSGSSFPSDAVRAVFHDELLSMLDYLETFTFRFECTDRTVSVVDASNKSRHWPSDAARFYSAVLQSQAFSSYLGRQSLGS